MLGLGCRSRCNGNLSCATKAFDGCHKRNAPYAALRGNGSPTILVDHPAQGLVFFLFLRALTDDAVPSFEFLTVPQPLFDRSQKLEMAPSAIDIPSTVSADTEITALRDVLTSEIAPLARRFRALFSLKHYAALKPPTKQTVPAIQAIAAAFTSPSALLKHELAYCLGQSRNLESVPYLRTVLEDKDEDSMCRHEAAEALGALGDEGSLALLKELRDDVKEPVVVRETCDIAVDRIEWEHSKDRNAEKLKERYETRIASCDLCND